MLLIVHMGLYLFHVREQDNFNWFRASWMEASGDDASEIKAVIPGVVKVQNSDAFGNRLKKDIRNGAIAFVVVLGCNQFVTRYFRYDLFNV